jgi:hypothetical protein
MDGQTGAARETGTCVEGRLLEKLILAVFCRAFPVSRLPGSCVSQGRREPLPPSTLAHGCRLLFLPAYSPDFSPIEEAFSKLKTFLR